MRVRDDDAVSTALRCALAALLLLTGCSDDEDDRTQGSVTTTSPTATAPATSTPAPVETPDAVQRSDAATPQPSAQQPAAPQPSTAGTGCEQDAAASRTCTFVEAVLTGAVTTLAPGEQEVAARTTDLPPAPWGLSGCDLVGDVTVECQVVFSPPREQEVVATFVLQPVDGGYAVTDYLGLL